LSLQNNKQQVQNSVTTKDTTRSPIVQSIHINHHGIRVDLQHGKTSHTTMQRDWISILQTHRQYGNPTVIVNKEPPMLVLM